MKYVSRLAGITALAGLSLAAGCSRANTTYKRTGDAVFARSEFSDGTKRYIKSGELRCDYDSEGALVDASNFSNDRNCIYIGPGSEADKKRGYCQELEALCDGVVAEFGPSKEASQ